MNETRVTIAITLAAVLCAWGAVEAYQWENVYQTQTHDPYFVRLQESRLLQVLATVPENAVIGYVTDLEPGSTSDSAAFGTARYVLAPRILERSTKPAWVLGIVAKPDKAVALGASKGLVPVSPVNNGALLYRHEGAQ